MTTGMDSILNREGTMLHIIIVAPSNKGHFVSMAFVLWSKTVLWWEVRIVIASKHHSNFNWCHSQCPLPEVNCPLVGGSIIGGSTVYTSSMSLITLIASCDLLIIFYFECFGCYRRCLPNKYNAILYTHLFPF